MRLWAHAFGHWGIVGVSLRSTEIAHDMQAQDCLYSVVARDRSGDSVQVVGSIVEAIAASEDGEAVLARLADPAVHVVTLTVSERGLWYRSRRRRARSCSSRNRQRSEIADPPDRRDRLSDGRGSHGDGMPICRRSLCFAVTTCRAMAASFGVL